MDDNLCENYKFTSMAKAGDFLEKEGFKKAFTHPRVGEYLQDTKKRVAVVVKGPNDICILTIFKSEEAMIVDMEVRKSLL